MSNNSIQTYTFINSNGQPITVHAPSMDSAIKLATNDAGTRGETLVSGPNGWTAAAAAAANPPAPTYVKVTGANGEANYYTKNADGSLGGVIDSGTYQLLQKGALPFIAATSAGNVGSGDLVSKIDPASYSTNEQRNTQTSTHIDYGHPAGTGTTTTTYGTGGAGGAGGGGGTSPNTQAELQQILSAPGLTADMKAAIQSVYDATAEGDKEKVLQIVAGMNAATKYSDPYFKAQIRLATDALTRGVSSKDGDLAFNEKQLSDALKDLHDTTIASEGQLSFEHQQELQNLATKYETDLGTTRDDLAQSGFTSSSKRARAETILDQNNTGLVESSNKKFAYDTGNLDRTLNASAVSTADQIANLQRTTKEGNLDLYRTTEAAVGSANLPSVDGLHPLGNVGGTIPQQQVSDAVSFANAFVP